MNLDDLLNEMSEKIRNRDLSDEYLREHNNSTREEIGIGEYAYGITMIPCEWVYEYLSDYKRVLKENELLRKDIEGWEKYCEEINEEQTKMSNKNCELEFEVEKLQKENEELKNKLKEKDKIIDLMAERAVLTEEEWKEIKEKNIYNVIQKDTHKLIKQYFENKAKEVKNGKYID
jgi:hypothetical protein